MVLNNFVEKLISHPRLIIIRKLITHLKDSEHPEERMELRLLIDATKASPTDVEKLKKDWEGLVGKGPWERLRDNFAQKDDKTKQMTKTIVLSVFTTHADGNILNAAYLHKKP